MIYFKIIKNAIQTNLMYKADMLWVMVSRIIRYFILICVWTALYDSQKTVNGIRIEQLLLYTSISSIISVFFKNTIIIQVSKIIKTGEISTYLLKPITLHTYLFCTNIGDQLYRFFFEAIPLMIIFCFYNNKYIIEGNFESVFAFIIVLICSICIYFQLTLLLGMLAFWFQEISVFDKLLTSVVEILSGKIVPLWFCPQWIVGLSNLLPFRLIYASTIEVLLGYYDNLEIFKTITQQVFWIMILSLICNIVWKYGIKKLTIQGG